MVQTFRATQLSVVTPYPKGYITSSILSVYKDIGYSLTTNLSTPSTWVIDNTLKGCSIPACPKPLAKSVNNKDNWWLI